ncbi:MAG TPA: serine hydrolase [Thermoanaerobaculia bacterium]|nr:serine hydrolase [Thermoanaerobaculia bacterium]
MLRQTVDEIAKQAGANEVAVAFYDWETSTAWSLRAERSFHAASTIKLAVLLALVDAVAEGRFEWDSWLHVRNRFASRVDAEPFRIARERDADSVVHAEIGKLMRVSALAERMIVSSSNLATNLLLDLIGVREAREALEKLGLQNGIDVVRGVEDHKAHEAGIDNRTTADGLLSLLRLVHEGHGIGAEGSKQMLDVLSRQELQSATRLGLPESVRAKARVANKTGEISTAAHDAGLVFLPDRRPFALVVLSEWPAGNGNRQAALGEVVAAVYRHFVEPSATVRLVEAPA